MHKNRKRRERKRATEIRMWRNWFADEERNADRRREHFAKTQFAMMRAIGLFAAF